MMLIKYLEGFKEVSFLVNVSRVVFDYIYFFCVVYRLEFFVGGLGVVGVFVVFIL